MKKEYTLIHVIIIIVITAIVSAVTTGVILSSVKIGDTNVSYSKLILDNNVRDFLDSYAQITIDYYENVDKGQLIASAINGMTSYLDESYTSYLDEDSASELMNSLNETFTGIGIIINKNIVINVLADSPAKKAGIIDGDVIKSIDNTDVTNMDSGEITELIKDKKEINIVVLRDNKELYFKLNPAKLATPKVNYNMIENSDIGYISISIFSANASKDTKNAINNLKKFGAKKFIIDLRGNAGGYLEQALDTSSLFLKDNQLVYYLMDKNKKTPYYDNNKKHTTEPIVVLVNKSTASAAEILTAALKDSYKATIVGQTTYGKGKVQHTHSLSKGGLLKYTSSKWLRPNGKCIDGKGIKPDYKVKNIEKKIKNNKGEVVKIEVTDKQLEKAIELLNK